MLNREFWLASIWILLIAIGSCARRGAPTGGEKDTIPPVLIKTIPALETVNFNGNEIELQFDELIEARNLKQELIVTPPIEEYDYYVNKNTLYIRLEQDLLDSTTYTFNFGEAIQDLSERNKAENAVVAFSTGSSIDSFQVSGKVRRLLTQLPVEEAVVALYNIDDTVDIFTGPPMYFDKTNEEGEYKIRYVKRGSYRIYAYTDVNSNLKAETNKESYGFVSDTIRLENPLGSSSDSIASTSAASVEVDLFLIRKNIQPLVLQSNRPNGKYYELKFNKGILNYGISVEQSDISSATKDFMGKLGANTVDTTRFLFHNLNEERNVLRVYNTIKQDSLRITLNVTDSTEQAIRDSVFFLQFVESRRKPEEFQNKFNVQSSQIEQSIDSRIAFNKPIVKVNTDSILLGYDTLFYLPINYESAFVWSDELDEVQISIPIDQNQLLDSILVYLRREDSLSFVRQQRQVNQYLDSLQQAIKIEEQIDLIKKLARAGGQNRAVSQLLDSLSSLDNDDQKASLINDYVDTAQFDISVPAKKYDRREIAENLRALNFYAAPGSFVSVEQDSNVAIIQRYTFKVPEKYGSLSGTMNVPYENYFLQLLNQNYEVVEELKNPRQYTFNMIEPGTYRLRILVDANNNGKWEEGNILLDQEPEPVLMYQGEVIFRENWEVTEDIDSNKLFTRSSE